ncbi:hypothetical protein L195_g044013 [Trifolium pratense]|uniref:Uncharacterized protein n=1 Tax=Trifolium pratense TaxID=57577 RepID=A0A2K3MAW1_TRIPR|nr:hypothetical protein L195_g044013 [Trifolium pratense]
MNVSETKMKIETFVEAKTKHPFKDHETGWVIIDNKYTETRRKLVGDEVVAGV